MRMRLMISTLMLATAIGGTAMAQDATTFTANSGKSHLTKEQWQKLTPEERAIKHAEHKAKWDALSPEEKARHKAERKARWDALSPEEKAQRKAERKARWDALSPEEKAHRQAERKARWDKLSPEEKAQRKEWREEHLKPSAGVKDKLLPSEEKTNRGHLRRAEGISRPAGVDSVETNR